jgi:Holliday junction resolvase RusA-like endonuclease
MKHDVQADVGIYISHLPRMTKPVRIDFLWTEKNNRRDYDNISSCGRKFILDALVASGKLPDDNRKYVRGFSDSFDVGKDYKVTLTITEIDG